MPTIKISKNYKELCEGYYCRQWKRTLIYYFFLIMKSLCYPPFQQGEHTFSAGRHLHPCLPDHHGTWLGLPNSNSYENNNYCGAGPKWMKRDKLGPMRPKAFLGCNCWNDSNPIWGLGFYYYLTQTWKGHDPLTWIINGPS